MTDAPGSNDGLGEIPADWDVIDDTGADDASPIDDNHRDAEPSARPPKINLVAAAWADGVTILAILTAALLGLHAAGFKQQFAALPWGGLLGASWWLFAASVLVTIRQGTPGMLLAGVQFDDRIAPVRVPFVVLTAAASVVLLGLPGLLGAGRSPLALAGARALETPPLD